MLFLIYLMLLQAAYEITPSDSSDTHENEKCIFLVKNVDSLNSNLHIKLITTNCILDLGKLDINKKVFRIINMNILKHLKKKQR